MPQYESKMHGSTPREHSFTVAQFFFFKQITQAYWLVNFGHVVTGKRRGPGIPQGLRMNNQNQINQFESPGRDLPQMNLAPHQLSFIKIY